jgi:hypothetical protein
LVEPFTKWIVDQKDKITASKGSLEDQLKYVEERIANLQKDSKVKEITESNKKLDAAGITNNKYTTLTAKDVEVLWDIFQQFLHKKKTMLAEAIEHNKLRGVTPEQFAEIDVTFKRFDADNRY